MLALGTATLTPAGGTLLYCSTVACRGHTSADRRSSGHVRRDSYLATGHTHHST